MSENTRIERTGTLDIGARFIMHFLMECKDLAEARKSLPELTAEQFKALRSGKARLTGSTNSGINYEVIK